MVRYTSMTVKSQILRQMAIAPIHRYARIALALCLLSAATIGAQLGAQPPAQPPGTSLPAPVGYVNDFAGVLSSDASARLNDLSLRVNAATRGDLVVVTMADLGDRAVEDVARQIGREWKIGSNSAIGDEARNAGVVLLIVPKETASDGRGRCRIEVGQGAEGFITDATAGTLCREAIPQFQARDYSGAAEFLAVSIAQRYAEAYNVTLDGVPVRARRQSQGSGDQSITPMVLLLIVIVAFMILSSRGGRRQGCSGCLPLLIPGPRIGGGFGGGYGGGFGGGGGGGFGGFGGGGGFSGGGGGSSW